MRSAVKKWHDFKSTLKNGHFKPKLFFRRRLQMVAREESSLVIGKRFVSIGVLSPLWRRLGRML
jgi:hypothetical protein